MMNLNVGLQHRLLQHHFSAHDAAAPSAHGRDFLADDPPNRSGLKSKAQTRCPPVLARRNNQRPSTRTSASTVREHPSCGCEPTARKNLP